MASVYKAYEAKLDRYVALKVLPREFLHDPELRAALRQEAQVIARLEAPRTSSRSTPTTSRRPRASRGWRCG
jgi:serine/threonine-protein kinase